MVRHDDGGQVWLRPIGVGDVDSRTHIKSAALLRRGPAERGLRELNAPIVVRLVFRSRDGKPWIAPYREVGQQVRTNKTEPVEGDGISVEKVDVI